MERPECAVKGCHNPALLMFHGKIICGECLMKIYKKQDEELWEDLNASS